MRIYPRISAVVKTMIVVVVVFLSSALIALASNARHAPLVVPKTQPKIEASILSYNGHDFIRTETTLMTKEGKSAVNTKLDHDTPAYKALVKKHSYTGEATIMGREYHANYAPLISEDGRLTGALFVGVPEARS